MGRHQSDRNLRNETQAQLEDLAEEQGGGLPYDEAELQLGDEMGMQQTGTGGAGATMRTRATPKTAAQQSIRGKQSNQPPNR